MLNTCKSNGTFGFSGERVSKAQVICRKVGDNVPKGTLIPDVVAMSHDVAIKDLSLCEEPASD